MSRLQNQLAKLGYYSETVDGDFGPATHEAVVNFQQDRGLSPDGIVGKQTLLALNNPSTPPKQQPSAQSRRTAYFKNTNILVYQAPGWGFNYTTVINFDGRISRVKVLDSRVMETTSTWYLVEYPGGRGWVSSIYLTFR